MEIPAQGGAFVPNYPASHLDVAIIEEPPRGNNLASARACDVDLETLRAVAGVDREQDGDICDGPQGVMNGRSSNSGGLQVHLRVAEHMLVQEGSFAIDRLDLVPGAGIHWRFGPLTEPPSAVNEMQPRMHSDGIR